MIKVNSLNKFYNKGKQNELHVLNDINLELPEKGMVAIFGKSGCGKTTLLNVIGGLDKYKNGKVLIEENDISNNTDYIRNKYIGYIFQNYNLNNHQSCYDNVANALILCGIKDPNIINERVMTALKNVGMEKYYKRTPDSLSGGQQQRIAIARAIVKNPKIILADEPTGNLDENNTIMIMNLLKSIAKEHLVLLVTHEENLVNYYCNKVINFSDGKIVNITDNDIIDGFNIKNKNHIYLGDLNKEVISNDNVNIHYYGNTPIEPINLKIINTDGKLYIQINTPKVQILDQNSETKLKEGKFKDIYAKSISNESIDMNNLPPINGQKYGSLYNFKSSIKTGYNINFKKNKKGRKLLHICMCLFAIIIVFVTAVFGTFINDIKTIRNSYNHNVFYVYTKDGSTSEALLNALNDSSTGIDHIQLQSPHLQQGSNTLFNFGLFETFDIDYFQSGLYTTATYLNSDLAKDLDLVEGRKDNLKKDEIIITTKVADTLLNKSQLGNLKDYKDLIGLFCNSVTIDEKNCVVAGIVDSKEPAIYLDPLTMAKYIKNSTSSTLVEPGSDFDININPGETTIALTQNTSFVNSFPKIGDYILIHGKEFKVTNIHYYYNEYDKWLNYNYPGNYVTFEQYLDNIIQAKYPDLNEYSNEWYKINKELQDTMYFNYLEFYNKRIDEFIYDYNLINYDERAWIYIEKGIEEFKYLFIEDGAAFHKATEYKKQYGNYPKLSELSSITNIPSYTTTVERYRKLYQEEMYYGYKQYISSSTYFLNDTDFVDIYKQIGTTDPTAKVNKGYDHLDCYTLIHSTNPEVTNEWLNKTFSNLYINEYTPAIISPDYIYNQALEEEKQNITISVITMVCVLIIMSICMYFIMKSSLMNRIKEIGILRAIGTSKKNLIFKFIIESIVLATFTIMVGYLIASIFIYMCLGLSQSVSRLLYYPIPIALMVLLLLYGICILFGILPIINLLRKTPNEILSKYDI